MAKHEKFRLPDTKNLTPLPTPLMEVAQKLTPPTRVLARFRLTGLTGHHDRLELTLTPSGPQELSQRTRFASTGEQIEVALVNDPTGAPMELGKEYVIEIRPA